MAQYWSNITRLYRNRKKKPKNEEKSYNGKLRKRLLLIVSVTDPKRFTFKIKALT